MNIELYCVFHRNEDITSINIYKDIIPYNINEYNNGELNPYICEYICQQNNINTNADYIGFGSVDRKFNKSIVENILKTTNTKFLILETLNHSLDNYLGEILCLNYIPDIRDITYKYLAEYGIIDIYKKNYWARYECYIAQKDSYIGLVNFINGYLDRLFSYYKVNYNLQGCKNIVEKYMKQINYLYNINDEIINNRIKKDDWYINKNSKFYSTIEEEIEYVSYITFKNNISWKYGNQFHRILAYIIEYLIGIYICIIDGNYIENTNIVYDYRHWD